MYIYMLLFTSKDTPMLLMKTGNDLVPFLALEIEDKDERPPVPVFFFSFFSLSLLYPFLTGRHRRLDRIG